MHWIDLSPSTSRGLVLLSTRFTEDAAGAKYHRECLAELRNDGAATLCAIEAHLSLKDGDEMERAAFVGFVDGPPFDGGSSASIACLAPGDHGAFFASDDVDEPVGPDTVRSVEVKLTSIASPLRPHAHAPTIAWMSAEHLAGKYFKLVGIASAHGAVHDVVLHGYPLVGGVLRKRLVATHPSTWSDSTSWSFATNPADAAFTDVLAIMSFSDGGA
ncbi:MAG: hypothetical protein ABI175_06465 [Polyangiales bacterium]